MYARSFKPAKNLPTALSASRLELRASLNASELLEDTFGNATLITDDDIAAGDLIPRPYPTKHFIRICVPDSLLKQRQNSSLAPVVYFAIRAWNTKNLSSEVSEIAIADFRTSNTHCLLKFGMDWPLLPEGRRSPRNTNSVHVPKDSDQSSTTGKITWAPTDAKPTGLLPTESPRNQTWNRPLKEVEILGRPGTPPKTRRWHQLTESGRIQRPVERRTSPLSLRHPLAEPRLLSV